MPASGTRLETMHDYDSPTFLIISCVLFVRPTFGSSRAVLSDVCTTYPDPAAGPIIRRVSPQSIVRLGRQTSQTFAKYNAASQVRINNATDARLARVHNHTGLGTVRDSHLPYDGFGYRRRRMSLRGAVGTPPEAAHVR